MVCAARINIGAAAAVGISCALHGVTGGRVLVRVALASARWGTNERWLW